MADWFCQLVELVDVHEAPGEQQVLGNEFASMPCCERLTRLSDGIP